MKQIQASKPDLLNESLNEPGTGEMFLFLDCLAALVARWKLMVGVTLLVGFAAGGVAYWLPKVYTSVAYLGPLEESIAKGDGAVIHSAPVLDVAIAKFPQYRPGYDLKAKRAELAASLHLQIVKGSPLKSAIYTLSLDDTDPHLARSLLSAILDSWLESVTPPPDRSDGLTKALAANEAQAADLNQVIAELRKRPDAMFADGRNGYFPPNIVDMIRMRTETAARIVELTMALRAGSRDVIFSPPTLPEQPSGPDKMEIVLGSMMVALGCLIAVLLLRWGLAIIARHPAYSQRITQTRGALL